MKLSVANQLISLLSLLFWASIASATVSDESHGNSVKVERILMHSPSLENNPLTINAERELLIVLPPSYKSQPNKKYPVVYLLHGLGANASGWFSDKKAEPNIQKALQKLYKQEQLSEMIVVVPDSYNTFAKGGWYSNSTAGGNWEDYIIKDVIPYIEKQYRTNQQRGLAGSSMGGYGAFRLAIKYPEMFGAIYAMSAALTDSSGFDYMSARLESVNTGLKKPQAEWQWGEIYNYSVLLSFAPSHHAPLYVAPTITLAEIEKLKENAIDKLLEQHLANFKKSAPVIKFDVGDQDYLKTELRLLSGNLQKLGIDAHYSEYAGGHSDKLHLLAEHEIFQYFSQFFSNTLPIVLPDSLVNFTDAPIKIEPQIVTLDSFEVTGVEAFGDAFSDSFFQLWDQLYALNIDKKERCHKSAYLGVSYWDKGSEGPSYYLVGCQAKKNQALPSVLNKNKRLPRSEYAVFAYKGVLSERYGALFQYIYSDWLPRSDYQEAGDYNIEFFGEEFKEGSIDSVMYIYVPIKKREEITH